VYLQLRTTIDEVNETFATKTTLRLLEQSMMTIAYCGNDRSGWLLKDLMWYSTLLNRLSAIDDTFVMANGTAGDLDYTTTVNVTVPAGATRGESVPTMPTLMEITDFTLPLELLRPRGQSMIMTMSLETIAPASATEGSDVVFNFTSNRCNRQPDYTFVLANGTAGDLDFATTTITA
jgi:hypothetical protein